MRQRLWKERDKGKESFSPKPMHVHSLISPSLQKEAMWAGGGVVTPGPWGEGDIPWAGTLLIPLGHHPGRWGSSALGQ